MNRKDKLIILIALIVILAPLILECYLIYYLISTDDTGLISRIVSSDPLTIVIFILLVFVISGLFIRTFMRR